MVRVSSSAKLRPWPELIAKMVMGVVPGLLILNPPTRKLNFYSVVGRAPHKAQNGQPKEALTLEKLGKVQLEKQNN